MRHREKTLVQVRKLESLLSLALPPTICNLKWLIQLLWPSAFYCWEEAEWRVSLPPPFHFFHCCHCLLTIPKPNTPCHPPRELWDLTSYTLKSSRQMQASVATFFFFLPMALSQVSFTSGTSKCKVCDYRPRVPITGFTMQLTRLKLQESSFAQTLSMSHSEARQYIPMVICFHQICRIMLFLHWKKKISLPNCVKFQAPLNVDLL